jgi:large subunit ribosomal protein L22
MEVKATAKFVRISPRKARLVVDMIRGVEVNKALDQLMFMNKRASLPVGKLVKSAIANAVNNLELKRDNLYIKEIKVDEGPTLHRWMPRARGRATPIRKRTSHIKIVLAEIVESGQKKAKKAKVEAPIKLDARPKEDGGVKIAGADKKAPAPAEKAETEKEKSAPVIDPRGEGKGKHTKIEGGARKGFVGKIFRRKSG